MNTIEREVRHILAPQRVNMQPTIVESRNNTCK